MKIKTKKYVLATTLLITTTIASAENYQKIGFYFGAGLSQTNLIANQPNLSAAYSTNPQSTFEPNGFGIGLMAGIKLDQHLAFEAAYTNIGSIALDNGTTQKKAFNADLFNINAVLSTPISNNINAFGKLGISLWETYDDDLNTMDSGNGLLYGAGFDINVYGNDKRTLRVEWTHNEFENIIFESAATVSVSALFNF